VDAIEAIHGRRTVRDFNAREPDRALIEALVWDAAQAPPPAIRNIQRWAFVVTTGAERLADHGERAKAFARAGRPAGETGGWLDDPAFRIFWNAPVLILICSRAAIPEAAWDCCRAGQNLMLSAHARGLGSCWVGSPMAWLSSPEGATAMSIPEGFAPVAPILVGYPKAAPPPRDIPRPEIVWA
jgi:nitroreductase